MREILSQIRASIKESERYPQFRKDFFLLSLTHTIIFIAVSLSSCSHRDQVNYTPGLYTDLIYGKVLADPAPLSPILLLVEYRLQTFMNHDTQEEKIYDFKTELIQLKKVKEYRISFPSDAKGLQVLVLAEGFKPELQSFSQSIGIGEINYTPKLLKDPNWKDNYFVNIKPMLTGYFLQKDKRMIGIQKLRLGEWISEVEKRL